MNHQSIIGYLMILAGFASTIGGILVLVNGKNDPLASVQNLQQDLVEPSLEPEEKGRKFEDWVVRKFNTKFFVLKEWRGDKSVVGISAQSSSDPDLVFEFGLREQKAMFAVECKWRRSFTRGNKPGIEWATARQIDRYQDFQRRNGMPVFAVIGVGGEPDRPSELYVVPLDRLKYPFAAVEYLAKYRKPDLEKDFYYDAGKSQLR
jgi:hypothetical protein